ncbi:deazapurine DNA modification protein DpdA family protein [Micromonospora echinofusca]
MAWSYGARADKVRLPGCQHAGPCNNCLRYALVWRERSCTRCGSHANSPSTCSVPTPRTPTSTPDPPSLARLCRRPHRPRGYRRPMLQPSGRPGPKVRPLASAGNGSAHRGVNGQA